jgi:hypothetical protein
LEGTVRAHLRKSKPHEDIFPGQVSSDVFMRMKIVL